ncbi:hypothetical protein BK675_21575 [Pseudomonas fluorescens]|nr:hypothetical protein BK677_11970 [Pseudomonas fluorescens]ROO05421.1 hypothetical protein BK675_21575 [Pseudomonas fluorescens]ROO21168.1 hypothetical protein BK676_01685 [Pseudomonas fluorescens]
MDEEEFLDLEGLGETFVDFDAVDKSFVLGRADFIRMAMPTEGGKVDLENFGGWLRIGLNGLYVNLDHEQVADLTPEEAASLCAHPSSDLEAPALKFPFTVGELERFLAFSSEEGRDVPLSGKVFEQVLTTKAQQKHAGNFENDQKTTSAQRSKHLTRLEQRLEPIRRWFEEQSDFSATNLRSSQSGKLGARDACWSWLEQQGLTEIGNLFYGRYQNKSNKTKKFEDAWSHFLKDTADRYPEKLGVPGY